MDQKQDNQNRRDEKRYHKALVMGKFMPLHLGHVALVHHALEVASTVVVAIVAKAEEPIPVETRLAWFMEVFSAEINSGQLQVVPYTHQLPHDGTFKPDHVQAWCTDIAGRFACVDAFVSSEAYGDVLAEYMGIDHLVFDMGRDVVSISGTEIRENPQRYRAFLPDAVAHYYGM